MLITKAKAKSVTSLTEGRYFSGMGIDYIGFSLQENAKNFINKTHAKEIMDWLSGPTFVAELVGASPEFIKEICNDLGIHTIQSNQNIDFTQLPPQIEEVIVNLSITNETTEKDLSNWMAAHNKQVSFFILDATQLGGWKKIQETGFDKIMKNLALDFPCFIKWDFNAVFIKQALEFINPLGVELYAGDELSTGMQSFEEVDKLMESLEQP